MAFLIWDGELPSFSQRLNSSLAHASFLMCGINGVGLLVAGISSSMKINDAASSGNALGKCNA